MRFIECNKSCDKPFGGRFCPNLFKEFCYLSEIRYSIQIESRDIILPVFHVFDCHDPSP